MIEVLIGPSGCGKSQYARFIWNENSVIISRDKIRELLWGYNESNISSYYDRSDIKSRENDVTKYQDELIRYSLSKGKTVILDNTHLKLKYINEIKKKFYYTDINFIDVVKEWSIDPNSLLEVCIRNNEKRVRKVTPDVIKNQVNDYFNLLNSFDFSPQKSNITPILNDININLPHCVIFDIDGTLALKGDRNPYDWKNVDKDVVNYWMFSTLNLYKSKGYFIIICTGRDGSCEELTKKWLKDNYINYDEIYIRPTGNTEPDYVVKERMWREIADKYYIECIYDDRNQVVDHARRLGLNVAQVNYGKIFK